MTRLEVEMKAIHIVRADARATEARLAGTVPVFEYNFAAPLPLEPTIAGLDVNTHVVQ
jgi:hypothetical protein